MRPLLLLIAASCKLTEPAKDTTDDTDPTDDTDTVDTDVVETDTVDTLHTDEAGGWCGVRAIFDASCTSCHGAAALGGLDLATDPYRAVVGVPSVLDPSIQRVSAGDPDNSLLYRMLLGTQPVGHAMPYGDALPAEQIELVRAWIADGANEDCAAPPDTDVTPARYHPAGYADEAAHGHDAKYQVQTCVDCHGADLRGAVGVASCDTCHPAGWRQDCTFCHGDPAEGSGAPPVHISGVDDGANASFIPHLAHVQQTSIKRALDCAECHVKPSDVLSPGHLFLGDSTPGRAEVSFAAGISSAGQWPGANGSCSNLWCHGTGQRDTGQIRHTATVDDCGDCHASAATPGRWGTMSGRHTLHLGEGLDCWECHGDTVDAQNRIVGFDEHVNRVADVALRQGMTWSNRRCDGTCHGERHTNRGW
ncbi:MAG TPA: hypothetical protein PKA64_19505 [Myxococcota bacterium]|nr:hypothetical protein [Myxococcota bacterium]